MKMHLASFLGSVLVLTACTSGHGRVTESISDEDAAVRLGYTGHVTEGDKVTVLRRECQERYDPGLGVQGGNTASCRSVTVGSATVVRIPDSRTAIVQADPGTVIKPGMFVRRASEKTVESWEEPAH